MKASIIIIYHSIISKKKNIDDERAFDVKHIHIIK